MKKVILLILIGLPLAHLKGQDLQELLDQSSQNWDSENYEEAFSLLSTAVEEAKALYEEDSEGYGYSYAFILNQMGVRLFATENFETAASYYSAAIPIFKEIQGEDGDDYLVTTENLALCYSSYGEYEPALSQYTNLLANQKFQGQAGDALYQTYNAAGICAYQTDNYELSKQYYEKGISLLNQDNPDYWILVENLIVLETSWSKYIEAYEYIAPFLVQYPERKEEYSNAFAYRYRDLGHVEFNNGRFAEAIPFFKNTIAHLKPTDSIAQLSTIYIYEDLAAAYGTIGNYAEGFPYLVKNGQQVKEHYGEESDEYLIALTYLSVGATKLGDYKQANKYYKEAYRVIGRIGKGEKRELKATFDTNYADYLLKLGEYEKANSFAKEALDFYNQDEETYFDDKVCTMNLMAVLMLSEGKYEKAESMLKQTLQLHQDRNGLENEMGTKIASNLTSLYIQTGRYSRAYQFLSFILANDLSIHGPNSFEYSFSLQVAGVLYIGTGAYEDAIESLTEAYEIREKLVGEENRELLRLKQSLGTSYLKAKKLDQAITMLTAVLETQRRTLGGNNFDVSLTQNDLGLAHFMKGDYAKAAKLFETSYKLDHKILGQYNQFTVTSQYNLGCTNLLLGEKEKAFDYFKKSMDDYLYILDRYFPYLSEKERLEYYHTIKGQLGAYFSFLKNELSAHPEYAALIYDLQIKTKALLLSESLKLRNFLEDHQDVGVQQAYQKWNDINREIAKLEQISPSQNSTKLDSLKVVGEEFERVLNSLTDVELEQEERSWKDVAATLKDGEVAIEIIRIKEFDFEKIVLKQESVSYLVLLIDNKMTDYPKSVIIEQGFQMDSKHFNVYKNSIKYKQQDKVSYKFFWEPIAEKTSGYNKAYVSADGVYHLLNLSTLFNPSSGKYVINEFDIEMVGNTRELIAEKRPSEEISNAVLFGFPNFNTQPDEEAKDELRTAIFRDIFTAGVSDLPETKVEINNINEMMSAQGISTSTFLSDEAHEEQLKGISSTNILHIATHGFFEDSSEDVISDDPLLHSGLLLANIKESTSLQEENGIITAKEVAQLNLSGSKLVVLSACETGKGKVVNGEGVYGLQRAFQVAGAENVIISLWKVDDAATQLLMTYFYEDYLQSKNPQTALRKAQIRLQDDYPHPNYWGAFYVIGK